MLNKEQHVLMKDSTELNEEANSLPETKLSTAVRGGMERGRKREMRRTYSYGLGAMAVMTTAVLLMFTVNGSSFIKKQDHQVQTSSISSVDDLESFPTELMKDSSLRSAIERGLVKPINQVMEKKGYRVQILGTISDGRKSYVLFNVLNNSDKEIILRDFTLVYGGYETPSVGAVIANMSGSGQIPAGQNSYYVYSTNLLPTDPYTNEASIHITLSDTSEKALNSSSKKYVTSMDVSLALDPNMFEDKERAYYPDRTLTVDGQKIHVRQLLFTPLNTYVDLEYDQANEKQIFKLLNPVLIGKHGDHTEKLYYPQEILKDNTKVTLVYKKSQLDQLDTTSFKTFGIAAAKKDEMKIVIDLKKKQIIDAPDDRLQLLPSDQEAGAGEVYFQRKLEKAQAAESFGMSLEDSFTDAAGDKHGRLSSENSSHSGLMKSVKDDTIEDNTTFNFGEDALEYPQPLTIGVKQYWIPIMNSQAVDLLMK
ncbi:hypothetical protein [Paenibacillus lautus]|uniref:hypothetical protein n=1 Tax=Paenibacillus lautus TaxID=1401 RepID=UPI003D2AAF8D